MIERGQYEQQEIRKQKQRAAEGIQEPALADQGVGGQNSCISALYRSGNNAYSIGILLV